MHGLPDYSCLQSSALTNYLAIVHSYVALYDGDGFLDFGMDATVMARRRGRVDFAFKPTCVPSCWLSHIPLL